MIKKVTILLGAGLFVLMQGGAAFACGGGCSCSSGQCGQTCGMQSPAKPGMTLTQVTTSKAVNVGNRICPVMGGQINDKNKVTYEYEGKIYNFCCAGCPAEFRKNPGKYIQKVQEKIKALKS